MDIPAERSPDFYAYYQDADMSLVMPNHSHTSHELVLIESGEAEFRIENESYTAGRNRLVVIGNLVHHQMHILDRPYCRTVLQVSHEFCTQNIRSPLLASFFLYRPAGCSPVLTLSDGLFAEAKGLLMQILDEETKKPPLWQERIQLLLELLLMSVYREMPERFLNENSHIVKTVFSIQRTIAERYPEKITLDSLAEEYLVSKYYLLRCFEAITGYSIRKYLNLYRIGEAKRLLETSNQSVTEIADAVGYGDINHFIRSFRQREGITPLQFRKNMQER